MKIVFLGTPEFAVASLEAILNAGHDVVGVVTAPDKPSGRGLKTSASAIKIYAEQRGLNILQPVNLKDPGFVGSLKELNADLFVVVAFRMLPEVVWNMPRLGTYNLHASLLPRYRGAAPINWAIINGDERTGVTIFKLQHAIDTGDVLLQKEVMIPNGCTAGQLHDLLKETGSGALVKALGEIENADRQGRVPEFTKQAATLVTHAPKLTKETGRIDWKKSAQQIVNLVHGLSPVPGAHTALVSAGRQWQVRIFVASAEAGGNGEPGNIIVDGDHLKIAAGEGWVAIQELQLEGKKRMDVASFLRGFRLAGGDHFL